MVDLYVAIAGVLVLGVALGFGTRVVLKRWAQLASLTLVSAILAALACIYFFNGWLSWAKWLPVDAAIVWTNFAPLFLCVAASASLCLTDRPQWRRVSLAVLAGVFAMATLSQPVIQPLWKPVSSTPNTIWLPQGVCQQSSPVTCSPAAAVTLLKANGIAANERELIQWCLTDSLGTTSLGLWRGLRRATEATEFNPVVMNARLEDLLDRSERPEMFPCLILVGFPRFGAATDSAELERLYTQEYGWPKGFRHSVVLFGPHPEGGLDVGDPSIGRERWSEQDLRVLWRGESVKLVPRG